MVDVLYQSALEHRQSNQKYIEQKVEIIENKIGELETKKSNLADMLASERIEEKLYDKKLAEITNEISDFTLELRKVKKLSNPISTIEQTEKCFRAFVSNKKMYSSLIETEKRKLLFELLSNIRVKGRKVVSFQYRKPYDIVAKLPKNPSFSLLCTAWDEVRRFLG